MKFSVIIPTWNEASRISRSLRRMREISRHGALEIILVDGGSKDATVSEARKWADKIEVHSKPNRGAQMHAGARLAGGDLRLFLHADTYPPDDWQRALEKFWLQSLQGEVAATVFTVDYGMSWGGRLVSWEQNARAAAFRLASGNAGICTTPEMYDRSGGIPEIPIMEDAAFCLRLRALGRIEVLPQRIMAGGRRLQRKGALLHLARNGWHFGRYLMGVPPEKIWEEYYSQDEEPEKKKAAAA
jgi:rSAM/selenodomain-associated transferase 2